MAELVERVCTQATDLVHAHVHEACKKAAMLPFAAHMSGLLKETSRPVVENEASTLTPLLLGRFSSLQAPFGFAYNNAFSPTGRFRMPATSHVWFITLPARLRECCTNS